MATERPAYVRPEDATRAEIIRFWRSVEVFSPQSVDPVGNARRVYRVQRGSPLPWNPKHELAHVPLKPKQTWQHVVFLGIYPISKVFDILQHVFEPDVESFDRRPPGDSAVAAFVVSAGGMPLPDSQILSMCAWGLGQAHRNGPGIAGWLSGFDGATGEFKSAYDQLPFELDHETLQACLRTAVGIAGVGDVLSCHDIRVSSRIVSLDRAAEAPQHDFLNSFYLSDLERVATEMEEGQVGPALMNYLRGEPSGDSAGHIDVQREIPQVIKATGPSKTPLGRWPTQAGHPLGLGQQLAVNSALSMDSTDQHLMGVNGPPGTGKTTLLRDIVAGLVVERAQRLAQLGNPHDAFTGRAFKWKTGEYPRKIHELNPDLTGFEIVVASSNNGAVENITNEIPSADAIADEWRGLASDLDYFVDTASALLAVDEPVGESTSAERVDDDLPVDDCDPDPRCTTAWAAVAARLGNKKNRDRFVTTFWYRKPSTINRRSEGITGPEDPQWSEFGLHKIMQYFETARSEVPSWPGAVAEFTRVREQVEQLRQERKAIEEQLAQRAAAERELASAREVHRKAEHYYASLRDEVARQERAIGVDEVERERWLARRREHREFRPKLLECITTLGKAMWEWRKKDKAYARPVEEADQRIDRCRTDIAHLNAETETAVAAVGRASTSVQHAERRLTSITESLERARDTLGDQLPDQRWWGDRDHRELNAPWTDREWNQARTRLFLAALQLHKVFLRHVPTQMRQSLHAAMDLVGGTAAAVDEEAALAAWRTFFLVVPVVSTTFASVSRLFSHLGREALGWLLIDEAGQATPQQPVGALWRSRRTVVVGDPLQLEPITSVPFRAEQALRNDHGADELWSPSRTSCQRLADRQTPWGTWFGQGEEQIWVGYPLLVHRRCDEPMFGISNTIAYDGLMIHATDPTAGTSFDRDYPAHVLPPSQWIDVRSAAAQGHWIAAEGEQLDLLLDALERVEFDMSSVMIIGPFRDVSKQIELRMDDHSGLKAGTVHTAQGKQADIVVLVLGSHPDKPGARRWAAEKPNLLNVAASRAKRRLYVIGDVSAWGGLPYFNVLARALPKRPSTTVDQVTSPHSS